MQDAIYEPKSWTGKIEYDRTIQLGSSMNGTVFEGLYNKERVAVKRIELIRILNRPDREIQIHKILKHDNVLKIFTVEQCINFRYLVLELCVASLQKVIDKDYNGKLPSDKQVMYEIANGLEYIHSQNISHRDIKPDNILVSMDCHIKLGDFDRSKKMSKEKTVSYSRVSGTQSWIAPEIIKITNELERNNTQSKTITMKGTEKSDIFSAGCVFFAYVTRNFENGWIHPFGNNATESHRNIENGSPINIKKLDSTHFAYLIICEMIKHDQENRMPLAEIKRKLLC